MSSGCLVLLQMAHFIFSLHTLAIWFGRKQQNWDLFYSITHWPLSLTVILFEALHCKLVAGLLVKLEFRGCLRWRQVEVGTSVNFPCHDDFAICHNDSCWNVRVISLSSLVLDHSWKFECRIGIVVCTCVPYYLLLPFCQSSTIYISEAGSCRVFKESLCYKNVPLTLQGLCKGHGGIVTVSLPKGMY